MAFASVGARGTATSKVGSSTLAISPNQDVPAGALLVLWAGQDGRAPGSCSPTLCQFWACNDSTGRNVWLTGGFRDSGTITNAVGGIFYCVLAVPLRTTDTITLKYVNANPITHAATLHEFSVGLGNVVACTEKAPQTSLGATDPAAITITGLASQEYLLLHALAWKGPPTDAFTWDADYTEITRAGTTGGTDASNTTILGGYRIATLTTDTVDVTSDTADRPWVQVYLALCEVAPIPFPTTPILDTFVRADESPLDNGTWDASACTAAFNGKLRVVSNRCATQGATIAAGQWWLTLNNVNDAEVYFTQPVRNTTFASNHGPGVILHGAGCGQNSTRGGLEALWAPAIPNACPKDVIVFGSCGNSATVTPAFGLAWADATNGVRLGQSKRGNVQHVWADIGFGFQFAGAIYRNTANPTSGKMGIELGDVGIRLSDFGGGQSVIPWHTLPYLGVGA